MAATVRSSSFAVTALTTPRSAVPALPTGTIAGDKLVAFVYSDGVPSAPTGWTRLTAGTAITGQGTLSVWWKNATSTEPTTYTFTSTVSDADLVAEVVCVAGADTAAPTIANGGSATASTAHVAPTITGVASGLLLCGYSNTGGTRTYTAPTGMTELQDRNASAWATLAVDSLTLSSSGATGTKTATSSASTAYTSASVAVTPAQDTTAPTAPTLTATAFSATQVNLSWSGATDAIGVAGYEVKRGTTVLDPAVIGTVYSDTTATAGTTLSYTVRAYDSAGNYSPASNTASATTPPAASTGTVSDIVANFTSDYGSFTSHSTNTSLINGRVRIPVTSSYENVESDKTYTLKGGTIAAQVFPGTATAATEASMLLTVNSPTAGDRVVVWIDAATSQVRFAAESGYWDPSNVTMALDRTAMAWFRIREAAGTTYWETSPDGTTWTLRKSAATPAWATATLNSSVQFVALLNGGSSTPFEVDNVNVAPSGTATPPANSGTLVLTGSGTLGIVPTRIASSTTLSTAGSGTLGIVPTRITSSITLSMTGSGALALTNPVVTQATPAGTAPDPANLWRAPQQVDNQVAAHPELAPIANTPQARWITEGTTLADVQGWATAAAGKTMVISVYAIPGRDNGQYSAGGFPDRASYLNFLTNVVKAGIGNAPAFLIYEADALGLSRDLPAATKAERIETLRQGVNILASIPHAETYIDASGWVPAAEQASLLKSVDVANIAGFTTNTSGYKAQQLCYDYGNSVVTELNNLGVTGKKFTVDSSRNGNGELSDADRPLADPWLNAGQGWCNPPKRHIGLSPGLVTGQPNVRATLWVKNPGESDGNSPQMAAGVPNTFVSTYYGESAPNAGIFWLPLARDLLGLSPQASGTTTPSTGTVSDVTADFETTGSGWGSFTIRSANATLVGGRGRIPVGVNAYENIDTARAYTLLGGTVAARMYSHAATGATSTSLDLIVTSPTAGQRILARIDPALSEIMFAAESGYYDPNQVKIPYDSVAHAWVRIRETGGTVYWDTSPDGTTWTNRKAAARPTWITSTQDASIQFVANRDAGTPNFAEVDNVNVTTSATPAPAYTGTLALLGSGTVTLTNGKAGVAATLALAGAGQLATSGAAFGVRGPDTGLAGAGSLALSGARVTVANAVALTGSGTLGTSAASASTSGSLSLSGSGAAVLSAARPGVNNSLTLSGAGALALTGARPGVSGTLLVLGDGSLSISDGKGGASGSLALSGGGSLAITPTHVTVAAVLALASSGALAASAARVGVTAPAALLLNGSGSIGLVATITGSGSLALGGSGSLLLTAPRVGVTGDLLALSSVGTLSIGDPNKAPVFVYTNGTWRPVRAVRRWTGRAWSDITPLKIRTY